MIGDVSLGSDKIIQLDVGHAHSCALTNKGEVRCWGDGKDGALGKTIYEILVMTNTFLGECGSCGLDSGSGECRIDHSCAMSLDGRGRCWGRNGVGQLGQE